MYVYTSLSLSLYIYIYTVKLKTGPRFAFYKLKLVQFFLAFYFQKSHSPCRKKRIFEKQTKKQQTNTHFYKLKTGPIMLRNILGPVFNLYLDQFLTYKTCFFFGGGGG